LTYCENCINRGIVKQTTIVPIEHKIKETSEKSGETPMTPKYGEMVVIDSTQFES
jgi:hypothetical protein